MRFKDWLRIDEFNKAVKRIWRQENPHIPKGVNDEIFHQRMGNLWRQSKGYTSSTDSINNPYADTLAMPSAPDLPRYDSLKSLMQDKRLSVFSNATWNKKPKEIMVNPGSFDQRTLLLFKYTRFGFNPRDEEDAERHKRSAQFAQEGRNEPVIILQLPDGKLHLLEGFHRTMQILLLGAPKQDLKRLKANDSISEAEFNQWKPVKLTAYIGVPKNAEN